jgi:hypothetical protein
LHAKSIAPSQGLRWIVYHVSRMAALKKPQGLVSILGLFFDCTDRPAGWVFRYIRVHSRFLSGFSMVFILIRLGLQHVVFVGIMPHSIKLH